MRTLRWKRLATFPALLAIVGLLALAAAACGGGEEEATPTGQATTVASPTATATPAAIATKTATPEAAATPMAATPTPTEAAHSGEGISLTAAQASITVDGDSSDWSDIPGVTVHLEQIEVPPGADIEFDPVAPIDAVLKVATDGERIYVLLEVPDDFDFNPEDRHLSAAVAVMFRIDEPAPPHMGVEEEDLETSLGMVDIWHWELDCGPGVMAGGVTGISGGNDPKCNFDDEYATTPEDREDDETPQAENSLAGVWEHTARAQGTGAAGTWIFEMSRPLQTGDPQDAQFERGGVAYMAIAYWDADESTEGWSDAGHVQSAEQGWIVVRLP